MRVQGESKLIFVWDMGLGMESPAEDQLHQNHLSYLRSRFQSPQHPHQQMRTKGGAWSLLVHQLLKCCSQTLRCDGQVQSAG